MLNLLDNDHYEHSKWLNDKIFLLGLNENECHKALFQDLLLYHLSTIYQAIFSLITYILLVN